MGELLAGYAAADITPPLGVAMAGYGSRDQTASGVNDPLLGQALVLESGGTACALLAVDLLGVDDATVRAVREGVERETGIPAANTALCASHTHWGPAVAPQWFVPPYQARHISQAYGAELAARLVSAAAEAHARRAACVAGVGAGRADGITFNRRQVGPDGKTAMNLALPPDRAAVASAEGNRLARAWSRGEHQGPRLSAPLPELAGNRVGPADGEVGLLRLDSADGSPLCALVNYACHSVCGGGELYHLSADFPGQARLAFEALLGAPLLFTAGCAGDQVPRWRGDGARRRVGMSLGAEAARVWLAMDGRMTEPVLACRQATVTLPLNPAAPSVEQAEAALAAHPEPNTPKACAAHCMALLAREIATHPEGWPMDLWAMRLGDLGIVAMPGEMLTEIGLQIKQRSPFAQTLVVSCANGLLAYLPTDDACHEGGYEPAWSLVGPGTERILVDTSLDLLGQLAG